MENKIEYDSLLSLQVKGSEKSPKLRVLLVFQYLLRHNEPRKAYECAKYFGVAVCEGVQLYLHLLRGVAQPGSALAWGARGRGFESRRPDHNNEPSTWEIDYQM
jgi:hypothetical protein